jgi:hypothetical protein
MDGEKLDYVIEFLTKGDTGRAVEELKKLQAQGEKTASTMEQLKGAGEKLVAFFGAEIVLREALDKFIEAERATAKLETALRRFGDAGEETTKIVKGLINELKEMTTFTGEEISNVVAKLLSLGATKDTIRPLTEAVLDLSTLMDKDLGRATQSMARALRGEFGAFTELGFKLDEAATTGEKLRSVLDQIGASAGGQAKAAASSLGGEMQNLKKRIDELKEAIGFGLGTGIQGVGTVFSTLGAGTVGGAGKAAELEQKMNDKLRAALEKQIAEVEAGGGPDLAAVLRGMIGKGFAGKDADVPNAQTLGLTSIRMHQRDPEAERQALREVQELLNHGTTSGAPKVEAPPNINPRNVEEEKAARLELQGLQREMSGETLNDYDRERAAIEANYDDRRKALSEFLKKAGAGTSETLQAEEQANEARIAQIDRLDAKRQESLDKQSIREMADAEKRADYERQLSEGKVASQLEGEDLVRYQMTLNHEARVRDIQQLNFENEDQYANALELERQLYLAEEDRYQKAHSFYGLLRQDLKQLQQEGAQAFSQGLAGAIVDSFEQGDKAFQKFAANFLRLIAQMILQAIILRIVQGAIGSINWGGGGVPLNFSAGGGSYPNLAADGINDVPAKTYFPRFNVIAGEAGREVMTVLSRPYQANIAGITAQIGNAGPRKLAIVDAAALASKARRMADGGGAVPDAQYGGGGDSVGQNGKGVLEVSLSAGLEARIVQQATQSAVVEVTRQMQRSSSLNQAMRRFSV